MSIRITCINKSGGNHADPHHAISNLGWVNEQTGKTGKNTRLEIYDWIKNQNGVAYVQDSRGNRAMDAAKLKALLPSRAAADLDRLQPQADATKHPF